MLGPCKLHDPPRLGIAFCTTPRTGVTAYSFFRFR